MQNVIVLGGSIGGVRAAHLLAIGLGSNYRVIMIDRNSHANHLYFMPRFGVVPGHEHKAFIPYTNVFKSTSSSASTSQDTTSTQSRHLVLKAKVLSLNSDFVTLDRSFPEHGFDSPCIPFRYAVYALGSLLPKPIDPWAPVESMEVVKSDDDADEKAAEAKEVESYGGTKSEGMDWLKGSQERIRKAGSVLCVGGGALGIQFATDIKALYPEKHVTLLHSRHRLLPRFEYDLHSEVKKAMEDLQIDMILGERLDLSSTAPEALKFNEKGQRVVKTVTGREVAADLLLLCTGQVPNTEILRSMAPESVDPQSKLAYVLPTMQLGVIPIDPPTQSPTEPEIDLGRLSLADQSTDSVLLAPLDDSESEIESDEPILEALPDTPYGHIFAIGDAADAFGAIKAGHTAYWQAEVAARNLIRLARRESEDAESASSSSSPSSSSSSEGEEKEEEQEQGELELESYIPGPPAIKVSLGVGRRSAYQIDGRVGKKEVEDPDDLDVDKAWPFFGMEVKVPEDMLA